MDLPLLLILFGPWWVYLICPVPDQLVEYRNYSMCAGMALILTLAIERGPGWLWVPFLIGMASLSAIRASSYSNVIRFWTEAAAHSSGDASRAFQELGAWTKANANTIPDFSAAEKYFREALRLNPALGPALNNLGWVLIQKRWLEQDAAKIKRSLDPEGLRTLEECTLRCPGYPVAWQDLGTVLENEGQIDRARECFERALSLDKTMQIAWNRLGLMDFHSGDAKSALSRFGTVSALNPSHWEYTYNKAVALKHAGQKEEGQKLLKTIPQPFPVTHNMIGMEFAK